MGRPQAPANGFQVWWAGEGRCAGMRRIGMKTKKSSARDVRKGIFARDGASGNSKRVERAVILDFIKGRIELFFAEEGGGIVVRKERAAYILVMADSNIPVARLRTNGRKGSFEVSCWSRARWRSDHLGEGGATFRTLDEALDFITTDPFECFWL
jgi:hypothetical protein